MPATFSLDDMDRKLLERAMAKRFRKIYGSLASSFLRSCAFMFMGISVFAYYKQWEKAPEITQSSRMIFIFSIIGFFFAVIHPMVWRWFYRKHVRKNSIKLFTAQRTISFHDATLILSTSYVSSVIQRSVFIDHTEDKRNHYLFVTDAEAIIIPKSTATALGAEFSEFMALNQW